MMWLVFSSESLLPREFHGLPFAETVAEADGHKPASLVPIIQVESRLIGFAFHYPGGEYIPDAQIEHSFAFHYFLPQPQVCKEVIGNYALDGLVPGPVMAGDFKIYFGRQIEFGGQFGGPLVGIKIE